MARTLLEMIEDIAGEPITHFVLDHNREACLPKGRVLTYGDRKEAFAHEWPCFIVATVWTQHWVLRLDGGPHVTRLSRNPDPAPMPGFVLPQKHA